MLVKLQKNHVCVWLYELNRRNTHVFLWYTLLYQKGITLQTQIPFWLLCFERKTSRGKRIMPRALQFQNLEHEASGFFTLEFSWDLYARLKSRNGDNRVRLTFWDGRWKRIFLLGWFFNLQVKFPNSLLSGCSIWSNAHTSLYITTVTVAKTHLISWCSNPHRGHGPQLWKLRQGAAWWPL